MLRRRGGAPLVGVLALLDAERLLQALHQLLLWRLHARVQQWRARYLIRQLQLLRVPVRLRLLRQFAGRCLHSARTDSETGVVLVR